MRQELLREGEEPMDIDKAVLNPGSMFARPADVCDEQALTREQKILILRRWEYDARDLEVAEEENMGGGPPGLLDEIIRALHRLDADVDVEHTPPTKQGGE
jgi:hypothetical protein